MIAINILILVLLISFSLHNLLSEKAGELPVRFGEYLGSVWGKKHRLQACHKTKTQRPSHRSSTASARRSSPLPRCSQGLPGNPANHAAPAAQEVTRNAAECLPSCRNIYFPVPQPSKENFGSRGKLPGKL